MQTHYLHPSSAQINKLAIQVINQARYLIKWFKISPYTNYICQDVTNNELMGTTYSWGICYGGKTVDNRQSCKTRRKDSYHKIISTGINYVTPVWWPGVKNSPNVAHACRKRRLK
jgi:hypothetical protein